MILGRREFVLGSGALALCGLPQARATPFERDRTGRIVVPVRINSRGPFRFALDTGATVTVISSWLAHELRLPAAPQGEVLMNGLLGRQRLGTVLIEALQTDGLSEGAGRLALLDPEVIGPVDGLLGADRLRGQRLDIDFLASQVGIAAALRPARSPRAPQLRAQRRFETLLALPAHMNRTALWAILDTGAQRTIGNVALQRALGDALGTPREGAETLIVHGAGGERLAAPLLPAPPLRLGAVELAAFSVAFADLPVFAAWAFDRQPALLLGIDLLGSLGRLSVDYPRARVRVSARP